MFCKETDHTTVCLRHASNEVQRRDGHQLRYGTCCSALSCSYHDPSCCAGEQVYKAIWQETTEVAVKMLLCKVKPVM